MSIVGDFDAEECLKIVLETIGTLPLRDNSRPYLKELRDVQFPKTPLEKTFFLDKKEGVKCCFGTITMYWPTCSASDWYKTLQLQVLAEILDWRLDEANKEGAYRFLNSRAGSYPTLEYNNYGKFEIHARIRLPEEVDYAEQILLNIVRDIRFREISNEELEQAINGLLEKAYRDEQKITYWRKAIDRSQESPDRLKWQKSLKETYKSFKVQDIQAIAEEFLNPGKAVTVKILP